MLLRFKKKEKNLINGFKKSFDALKTRSAKERKLKKEHEHEVIEPASNNLILKRKSGKIRRKEDE